MINTPDTSVQAAQDLDRNALTLEAFDRASLVDIEIQLDDIDESGIEPDNAGDVEQHELDQLAAFQHVVERDDVEADQLAPFQHVGVRDVVEQADGEDEIDGDEIEDDELG